MKISTFLRILSIVFLLIHCQKLFCQNINQDSLALRLSKAINLTDSINSPLPESIRILTMSYFIENHLKPNDYFTLYDFEVDKMNNLGEIETFKIKNRNGFKSLDTSDISRDSKIIVYIQNIKEIKISWIIEFYRIGAFRDYYFNNDASGFVKIGGLGERMDDIQVHYNSNFSKILNISKAE